MRLTARSGWRWPGVRNALILLLASLGLAGCTSAPSENNQLYRVELYALGTQIEVQIRAETGDDSEYARAQLAFRALNQQLQRMHREWHPWESGAMADLNAGLADGEWIETTPDLITLIKASQQFETNSTGLFNPAIGELIQLWGFHTSDYPITKPPPASAEIERLLASRPSSLQLEINGLAVRANPPPLRLDFSGLAKGLAVRQACEQLVSFNFSDALINAGGDVMVCGMTDQPWRVAIRNPAGGVLQTIEVNQPLAIFTSGNYYRYGEWDGQRYAHILDPRTGQPVHEVMQASVIHPDPLLADAAATTLIVAGSARWTTVAERMGVERVIIVDAMGKELTASNPRR